jgi:hypothetical protein
MIRKDAVYAAHAEFIDPYRKYRFCFSARGVKAPRGYGKEIVAEAR